MVYWSSKELRQWLGVTHALGRVTGHWVHNQLSLGDIFDKPFPLGDSVFMTVCVISKDICKPWNIVVR